MSNKSNAAVANKHKRHSEWTQIDRSSSMLTLEEARAILEQMVPPLSRYAYEAFQYLGLATDIAWKDQRRDIIYCAPGPYEAQLLKQRNKLHLDVRLEKAP